MSPIGSGIWARGPEGGTVWGCLRAAGLLEDYASRDGLCEYKALPCFHLILSVSCSGLKMRASNFLLLWPCLPHHNGTTLDQYAKIDPSISHAWSWCFIKATQNNLIHWSWIHNPPASASGVPGLQVWAAGPGELYLIWGNWDLVLVTASLAGAALLFWEWILVIFLFPQDRVSALGFLGQGDP